MAVAAAKKSGTASGAPAQYRGGPGGLLRTHRQARHDAVVEGDELIVTKEPVSRCQPVVWHFDDVKSLVMNRVV